MRRFGFIAACSVLICTATAATAIAGVFAFGSNSDRQTGVWPSSSPVPLATPIVATNLIGRTISQVSAGGYHSLVLTDDGTVFSFGSNYSGQTGLGTLDGMTAIATPIDTTNLGGRKIVQVSGGVNHSLLLADDGSVFSFGQNVAGQLGLGTSGTPSIAVATPINTTNLGNRKIIQVSAGNLHSLLLADDGIVFSFGSNFFGQTGLGASGSTPTTVAMPIITTNLGGRKITQVAAGEDFSLLLADDGSLFSFGRNTEGQLGIGSTSLTSVPLATPIITTNLGGRKISDMATGATHSLLLAEDGSVFSFGSNLSGKTGQGTTSGNTLLATPIIAANLGGRTISDVSAGLQHSLLLADDGSLFSFGDNTPSSAQLGLGISTPLQSSVPLPINTTNLGGQIVTQLDAGRLHNLLIAEPRLPGDYNQDGTVDAADYVVWRKTGGQTGAPLVADGDQDHQIDADDYNVWRGHLGTSLGNGAYASGTTGVSTVPEPATLFLLLLGPAVTPYWRRRMPVRISSSSFP